MQHGLECLELHLDLPPETIEIENARSRKLRRQRCENKEVTSGFERSQIDGSVLPPLAECFLARFLRSGLALPDRDQACVHGLTVRPAKPHVELSGGCFGETPQRSEQIESCAIAMFEWKVRPG